MSAAPKSPRAKEFDFDVCLSFAGEDRGYVSQVADALLAKGIRTFYDEYEQVSLWGKDLYTHLADIYQNSARYCVIFVSKHYRRKLWTNHERKSAQARAFTESREYVLPVKIDKTRLPGLLETTGYIDAANVSGSELADLIMRKVGRPRRKNFFPPVPDRLFKMLHARSHKHRDYIVWQATSLVDAFKRMTDHEKNLVSVLFTHGCPAELPDNIHISADLFQRITALPLSKAITYFANHA